MIQQTIDAEAGRHSVRRTLQSLGLRRTEEFWALRDVSFEVERGETLGIIGHNGAGKSTILKLLSNVTAPTSGEIAITGQLSALIEVGSGFHPELTGRENIYLSGSILGMRRSEIAKKLERIIDFAGVREFIDMPVKHYSSGMYVRLGFSIAAHLEPDILLLDEVLAVGDAAFQAKCLDRINELQRHGRTIVFISHDLISVERLCPRVLLLDHGQVIASGSPRDVIGTYQEIGRTRTRLEHQSTESTTLSGEATIRAVTLLDGGGGQLSAFRTGSPVAVRIDYVVREPIPDAIFEVYVYSMIEGMYGPWCQLTTVTPEGDGMPLESGPGTVEFQVEEMSLLPGICYLSARIARPDQPAGFAIDWRQQCAMLRVNPGRPVRGTFYMPHRWRSIRPGGVGAAAADALDVVPRHVAS
jgi:homopolymeric O-antigen transport system ATP-binding protein